MHRLTRLALTVVAVAALANWSTPLQAQEAGDIQAAVDAAYAKYKGLQEGKNADYIPALAKVDPNLFGIAVVTADGKVYTAGDVTTEVSIQSISKVFTMAQVIQEQGLDSVAKRIGVDATGARFNSIIAVEAVKTVSGTGAPEMNPLVNPGAISTTSMVTGASSDEVWAKIIGFHNDAAGRPLTVLQDVYKSESDSNQRNQAIGALMLAYGYIKTNWQQAVDLYTRQCSIGVSAKDLAVMAATLAGGGRNPVTGKQVMDAAKVPGVLAVMATAGLYDDSGKWLYHSGLPAKSGVGGGIIAVSPGKFGIAVVSPPLDDAGNSVRAQRAITDISNALGGNPLAGRQQRSASLRRPPAHAWTSTASPCSTWAINFKQNNPNWFDIVRVTQAAGVRGPVRPRRQLRSPASVRAASASRRSCRRASASSRRTFEFELFGTGVDAGQTTFRLRHAYGELGHFGAGQTWSPFMDIDVFPNSIEYWGPNGMVFFRNVQARWMPLMGDTSVTLALERPGASGDQGVYSDRIELQNIKGRFPLPGLLGRRAARAASGATCEVAGILRQIKWDDMLDDQFDLSGSATGWGINVSTNLKTEERRVPRVQFVVRRRRRELHERLAGGHRHREQSLEHGHSHCRQGAARSSASSLSTTINWNEKWTSTVGLLVVDIDNSDGQTPDAYQRGHYALGNLLYHAGPERDGRRRAAVGPAREQLGRLHVRRRSRCSSRSSTTSRYEPRRIA